MKGKKIFEKKELILGKSLINPLSSLARKILLNAICKDNIFWIGYF